MKPSLEDMTVAELKDLETACRKALLLRVAETRKVEAASALREIASTLENLDFSGVVPDKAAALMASFEARINGLKELFEI
jgi:hypothetical protein